MTDSSSESDGSVSSASAHSPSEERASPKRGSPNSDTEGVDPEQDALVGEKSLDDRFNKTQLELLVSRKDEYRHAGAKQRRELALRTGEIMAAEMITSGVNMSEVDRAGLFENVKLWFSQRARTRKEPLQWTVHWSAREVFYKDNKEKVLRTQNCMYEAHTGKKAGNGEDNLADLDDIPEQQEIPKDKVPQPFHFFQKALTAEWDALAEKERDLYEEKARVWRSLGPDEEERCRLAERHAPRTIRSLATSLYRQMGVRMFVLATWEDTQGRVITVPLDFNHELGSDGRSYKIEHRAYLEKVGLLDHYASFAQKIWPDKTADIDRETSPMDITFKTTDEGRAILPDPSSPHPVLKPFKYLPNLVRKFMDADYGLSRGIPVNRKSGHQIPWLQLQTRLEEFIDGIYLPEGWTGLKDPGGLGVNSCRILLNHWWKRQQEGSIPFQFRQWEASPALYEADGVTVKKPAKMVPREPLPLPGEADESEGEDNVKKNKIKTKPKRTQNKKPKPKSSLPATIPVIKSRDRSRQSKSRSPSRVRRSSFKGGQEPTSGASDEDDATSEKRGRRRQRSRVRGKGKGARGDSSESSDSSDGSVEPIRSSRGRSKGKSALPDLVNATKDLSLATPPSGRSAKAANMDKEVEMEVTKRAGGKTKKKLEKGTVKRANSKGKDLKKGKGRKKREVHEDLDDDFQEDGEEEDEEWDKQEDEEGEEDVNEEQDEEDEGVKKIPPSSSPLKSTLNKKKKKGLSVVPVKKVKWKNTADEEHETRGGTLEPQVEDGGPLAKGPQKLSAEERDLLALANSPRYRLDSPTRRRPKTAKAQNL